MTTHQALMFVYVRLLWIPLTLGVAVVLGVVWATVDALWENWS